MTVDSKLLRTWTLTFLSLVIVSCGGESGPPEPSTNAHAVMWQSAWNAASDSQREAMKDGEVTFDEYEAAALQAVQCINGIGMQGEAVFDAGAGVYKLAARLTPEPGQKLDPNSEDLKQKRVQTDACYVEHWNGINDAWSAQNQPSEQQLIDARQAFADCLRDSGLDVPGEPTAADIDSFRGQAAFVECAGRIEDEFGLPYFAG